MGRLKVSANGEYFVKDGKKTFLLCDTVWSAVYNISDSEWRAYLDYRKMQGYNAVQFNSIQQWDGGTPDLGIYPFERKSDETFDYYKPNAAYFERARSMMQLAADMGFIPMVFVLHASYTAGTWAVKGREEHIMPQDVVRPFAKMVAETFVGLDPIYIVAGDTNLDNDVTKQYFWEALRGVKEADPEGLCTFHLVPGEELPEEFTQSELYEYYALQPGHRVVEFHNSYSMPWDYYFNKKRRPIINDEFFYEGHGHTGEHYGRYDEFDQRKSIWQSILSGAKGGIAYGAHGLWGWNNPDKEFKNSSYAGPAFTWQTALRFEGAWEGSFAKYIFDQYDLFDLVPFDGIINESAAQRNEIRVAKSEDGGKIVIYAPYSMPVKVAHDLSGYDFVLIDMKHKRFGKPTVVPCEGGSELRMYDFNADALFIGVRRDGEST